VPLAPAHASLRVPGVLAIPLYRGGYVHFLDVLHGTGRRVFEEETGAELGLAHQYVRSRSRRKRLVFPPLAVLDA
jgi:hypothetical protein